MEQNLKSITTSNSQSEGRLRVDAGSLRSKKKKFIKDVVNKYVGTGGPGYKLSPPTYSAPASVTSRSPKPSSISAKKSKLSKAVKPMKVATIQSAINSLNKKLKFGKVVKKSLKN